MLIVSILLSVTSLAIFLNYIFHKTVLYINITNKFLFPCIFYFLRRINFFITGDTDDLPILTDSFTIFSVVFLVSTTSP